MALQRAWHPVPEYVEQAINQRGLMDRYLNRPPYQRNDYIGWITRAKREETRYKRLQQMLDELETGDSYMGMVYKAK